MLHLIVLDRAAPTEPVALAAGQRIGRHPRCEVRLDDPSISRLHARVEERAGALWLVDADSRNGLRFNGQSAREIELVPSVEFAIGRVECKVEQSQGDAPAPNLTADGPLDAPLDEPLEEDLDFEDDFDLDAPTAFESPTAAPAPESGGFELEDPAEIELGAGAPAQGVRPSPEPVDRRSSSGRGPVTTAAPSSEPEGVEPTSADSTDARRARVLADVADGNRGLLRGDLEQFPGWVQGLVWIGALAFLAGVAWGVLKLVGS